MERSRAASAAVDLPPPQAGIGLAPGTVQVSVWVPASIDEVWAALTERDIVARWFGDLSTTLKLGGAYRLDFGDGDFFTITDVALAPPNRLSYRWRFLGTGPDNDISWSIASRDGKCLVTVTDFEASRTRDGVAEMTAGWTDFLQRLQAYGATGQNSRYAWRKEFDGSIELPIEATEAFDALLSAEGQRHWMPWSAAAIAPGTPVTMSDGNRPERLTIGTVERSGSQSLRFTLTCPEWRAATECLVRLQPWPRGSLLIVSHNGWQAISLRDAEQAAQRMRFGTLWTQALRAARQVVSG